MVSAADSAFDLRILEICLLLFRLALVLCTRLPVRHRSEDNIFRDTGCVCLRAFGLALLVAEFRPVLALGDTGIHDLLDDGFTDFPGGLDFLAIVADGPGYDGFGAVFVLDNLLLGELDGIFVFFFGPVGAALEVSSALEGFKRSVYVPSYSRHVC